MRSIRSGTEGVRDFDFLKHGSQIKWGRYKVHTNSIIYYFFSACQYSILQLLKVCQLNRNHISEYSSANIISSQLLLHILAYRHNSIHICQFCETQTDWLSHLGWSYQSVYTRIWKEDLKSSRTPKIMSARNRLRADRNQLIRVQCARIGFLHITPADNDRGYDRRWDETCWTLQKRKD